MNPTIPDVAYLKKPIPKRNFTLQFSIRGLLIGTAVVACFLGAIAVPEVFAIVAGVAMVAITAMLITTIVCGRGWIRAFAIGSLVTNLLTYLVLLDGLGRPEGILVLFLISILVSCVVGGVTALTHGFLKRRGGQIGVPNVPFVRDWLSNE